MDDVRLELPQGTLDLLILKAVALEPLQRLGDFRTVAADIE